MIRLIYIRDAQLIVTIEDRTFLRKPNGTTLVAYGSFQIDIYRYYFLVISIIF